MIKRKNGLRIICMILVFIQCFCIMAPNVEALGNLDFSSAMMTGLINDSGQNVALGINERRITLLDNQNKRVENFVLEVDLKSFPNTSIVTGSYKDGTGYGMTTVAEQAKAAIDNGKPVVAAVNADYYNMATGEPIGCFVKDGAVINELPSNRCYFGVRKDGTPVIGDYNSYMAERAQLQEAVGGLCKLVDKGVVIDYTGSDETYYTTKQPRTAVGIKADGSVVFMVSDGRQEPYSAGLTMYELGLLMKDLGCEIALNLDGGGSSTYISREQGTDNLVCKNKPSDLTERPVANSLLILSKTPADHVFSAAVVEPFDKTYTPDSTVSFTAKGMDASGASAALPESGLYWKLSDDSFGTIDPSTGAFVSNGKQGQVQVQLVKGEPGVNNVTSTTSAAIQEVGDLSANEGTASTPAGIQAIAAAVPGSDNTTPGSLAITSETVIAGSTFVEIQVPDKIFFKQSELSLEFNVSSDLYFAAQYHGRDVILKPGDIIWDIPAGMGTMDSNNIFHTSLDGSVSGVIKATLAGTDLVAALDAKVGQLPVILYNFENGVDDWKPGSANRGEVVSIETVDYKSGEPVRFGDKSLKINFDLKNAQTGTTLGVYAGPGDSKDIPGAPKAIGAWIYATEEAQGYWLRMYVFDKNGQYKPIDFTTQKDGINWTGWKYVQADIPSTYQGPFKTYPNQMIRMMSLKSGTTGPMTKGEIYVDNVRVVYGASVDDMYHPIINDINVDGRTLSSNSINVSTTFQDDMTDKYATGMNYERINMYIDGKDFINAPGIYALNKGQNTVSISGFKLPDGLHRADVAVQDKFGNETRKTAYFTVKTGTGTTVSLDSPDKDGAPLGGTYKININTNNSADIKELTAKIKIGKEFPVESVDFGPGAASSVYNPETDYSKGILTLHIKNDSSNASDETLAAINIKVPAATTVDQLLAYSVEYSDIVYNSNKGTNYYGSFCELPASVSVTSDYSVEVKERMVGRNGVVLVKDRSGNPVGGASVKVVADGTTAELGITDAKGIAAGTAMTDTVKKLSVYAEKDGRISFTINTQSLKPLKDNLPSNILSTAVENSSTSKKITWMSNPLTSENKALIQYALKKDYENSGEAVFTSVEGTSSEKSFTGESDINSNGIVKFNSAVINGLTAGVEYCFRVGDGVNWSTVKEFTTTLEGSETNFFVLGDTQSTDMTNLTSILNSIAGNGINYDFAMHAGDIVDEASKFGLLDLVSSTFESYTGSSDTDFIPVLGNHEYMGDETGDMAKSYYNTPLNGPQSNKGACYSVEYGNVYVAVISFTTDRALLQEELAWLKKDAAKTTKKWKVLLTHQPVFFSNPEGGNGLFKEMLPAVMDEAGIDFVFSGHDHAYGRTKKLKAGQESPLGTTYIISGSTGTKYYGAVNDGSFDVFNDEQKPIYITARATGTSMTINALRPDGTVVDTFTSNKINFVNAKIEDAETFPGGTANVKLKLSKLKALADLNMKLSYDAEKLKFKKIAFADSLTVDLVNTELPGEITFSAVNGQGITADELEAAVITFEAGAGAAGDEQIPINIVSAEAIDSNKQDIYVEKQNGKVSVRADLIFTAKAVTISGEAVTGKTIEARYTYYDPKSRPEQGTTFRWLISNANEDNYTEIANETSGTLLLKPEYAGKKIKVEVTVRNADGSGVPAASEAIKIVAASNGGNTGGNGNSNGGSPGGGNSGGSSSSTGQSNQSTTAGKTDIVVNGQTQTGMADVQVKTEANGQKVTVVTVNSEKMQELIAKSGEKAPEITISINGQTGTFRSELRGDVVKGLIEKKALVRIKTESAQYSLPASQLNLQKAMEKFGSGKAKPEDIKLNLNVIASDNSKADAIAKAAQKYGFQALGSPVTFKAEFVYNNQSFPVNQFSGLVEKLIAIPSELDYRKITTAVEIAEDGAFRQVPTKIVSRDGKYYAQINSATNGTYVLVSNIKAFNDMSGHWAESIVNNMGSRFIINGVGNDKFNPNGKITGAEFTAIIVNALGLSVDITRIEGVGASDQKWYAQFLAAAEEYGLFAGTDTVKSKPMEIITREQALTIISNAIAICNQKVELSEGEGSLLSKFSDQNNISDWARGSIEICLKTGIVVGRGNGEIAPKDNLTRAETAAIIQKFLQQMGLVDK